MDRIISKNERTCMLCGETYDITKGFYNCTIQKVRKLKTKSGSQVNKSHVIFLCLNCGKHIYENGEVW